MSYGMMCGTHWGGRLGVHPGWNVMSPFGSTLGGGTRAASGIISGVCTLGGGVTLRGYALENISASFRSAAVCLSHNIVSGIVGVGLRRESVKSAAECIDASLQDSLGKVSISGKKLWCLRLFIFQSWGYRTLGSSNVALLA